MTTQPLRSIFARRVQRFHCLLLITGFMACGSGCGRDKQDAPASREVIANLWVGQATSGDGNELASVDLVFGEKNGPAGNAFATGLTNQKLGYPAIVVVAQPNLAVKPATLLVPRVPITGPKPSIQFFDPAQQGVARAVIDAVTDGTIPREMLDTVVIIATIHLQPDAEDKGKIFKNAYDATKMALKRAKTGEPKIEELEKLKR